MIQATHNCYEHDRYTQECHWKTDAAYSVFSHVYRLKTAATLVAVMLVGGVTSHAYAQGHYYRYTNEEGVKVMGHSIPPQYVANGYDILAANGRVIQSIEPAPAPELAAAARAKAEIKKQYELLARRYSHVRDIEAAKQRKMVHVDASIVLIEGSIEDIQHEVDDITARAANFERAAKEVPQNIINTLSALNEKMVATKAIRANRLKERQEIIDRFAAEKLLFSQGIEGVESQAASQY